MLLPLVSIVLLMINTGLRAKLAESIIQLYLAAAIHVRTSTNSCNLGTYSSYISKVLSPVALHLHWYFKTFKFVKLNQFSELMSIFVLHR